jgi:RNA polymerase sigma factor (sigma-70 family)
MSSNNEFFSKISAVELFALCASNNARAWEEFFCRFHRLVAFYALRETRNFDLKESGVDEIVQEFFVRILSNDSRALRNFQGNTEAELNNYLSKIVHNIVLDLSRREKQNGVDKVISLDDVPSGKDNVPFEQSLEAGDESSPDWILKSKFSPQQIQELLKSVLFGNNASRDAIVFYLFVVVGLSAREISQMPAISLSTTNTETIILRTRQRLSEVLNKDSFRKL